MDFLTSAGYEQYEISSWATSPEFESRHNKAYWQMTPYLGIGAAAAGFAENVRTLNTPSIPEYVQRISTQRSALPYPRSAANREYTEVDGFTLMQESMMLGLRLTRELMLRVSELGLPVATELLDPFAPQYLFDAVAWACLGARTTEDQY